MKLTRINLLFVLLLLFTAACTPSQPQATPQATSQPTIAPTSAPAIILPPADPTAAPTTVPAITQAPAADEWTDRSIFRSGLVTAAQPALDQLPGASVYHMDVQIAADYASLDGQEQVRYTNQEDTPLDAIYFQLFPNHAGGKSSVSQVTVDGQAVDALYEDEQATVRIPLTAPLQPGQQTLVQLKFAVEIPTQSGGNYGIFGYLKDILVLDGFYPAIPVYDAAGWHAGAVPPNADSTFQDASFYLVRVTAPAEATLVATGTAVEKTQSGANQIVTFAAGPARDFYLAASPEFSVVSQQVGETTVNSYAAGGKTDGAQAALETAVKALQELGARFGAYPYSEYDVVSTPMQGAYGIEYPGLAGINLDLYNLKDNAGGAPVSVILESTVAHEVGHQWFYNVVGSDQANQPWLDEAVTQYVTGLYYRDAYGEAGWQGYYATWESRWQRADRALIPIGAPAGDYQGREYSAIVYGRGPLFLDALAQQMGQETFDQFLRDYYQSHQWGIATAADFRQQAEKHCQCDLSGLFADWVDMR